MFTSFGWYIIPVGHFPPKSLSRNPRRGSPLLPITRPHPILLLTYGSFLLYWLGTSRWCLNLVCALHSHTSPLFFWSLCVCQCLRICLPCCIFWCLFNFFGVDEFLGLHSLHLVSFALLGCGLSLL